MSNQLNNLVSDVTALVNRWNTREDQMIDWLGGTVDGGPNGDGRYPLTDALDETHLVTCPAALADTVVGPSGQAVDAKEAASAAKEAAQSANGSAQEALSATQDVESRIQTLNDNAQRLRNETENSANKAMDYRDSARDARDAATVSEDAASASATAASNSESAAATSASNAASSEDTALTKASEAATSSDKASSAEKAAQGHADDASASASAASDSQSAAATSESSAESSASAADSSKSEAAASASEAAASASSASDSASEAASSATDSADSAASIEDSEKNAAASASNAKTYRDQAQDAADQVSVRNNDSAMRDPGPDDDETQGWSVRSAWINTSSGEMFRAVNVSEGSASWAKTTFSADELGSAAMASSTDFVRINEGGNVQGPLKKYGYDVLTEDNRNELATASQGDKADSAVQPGDPLSFPRSQHMQHGKAPLDMNNSDIVGANKIAFNNETGYRGGLMFLRQGAEPGSTNPDDYHSLRVYRGTVYVDNQELMKKSVSITVTPLGTGVWHENPEGLRSSKRHGMGSVLDILDAWVCLVPKNVSYGYEKNSRIRIGTTQGNPDHGPTTLSWDQNAVWFTHPESSPDIPGIRLSTENEARDVTSNRLSDDFFIEFYILHYAT